MRLLTSVLLHFGLVVTATSTVSGQPTNAEVMVSLVSACIAPAVEGTTTVRYSIDDVPAFIETGVVAGWLGDGLTVVRHDTDSDEAHLTYGVADLAVGYKRAPGNRLERTIVVHVGVQSFGGGGAVQDVIDCPDTFTDVIDVSIIPRIEDSRLPETRAEAPRRGFIRRVLHPVVVAGASAVAVYLFFSIRSDDAGS